MSATARPTHAERCSPLQERLWFLDRLVPASGPAHNVCTGSLFRGEIYRVALAAAVRTLVARHEALRSRFVMEDSRPARVVDSPETAKVELEQIAAPRDSFGDVAREIAATRFDLERGPLARFVLLSDGDESLLVVCVAHVAADGWSMGVLHRELGELYAGAELPPLELDFSRWVAAAEERAEAAAGQRAFWRDHLAGATLTLELPTDRRRPDAERYVGERVETELGPELIDAVQALTASMRATPFAAYVASWACVLADWTGQRDLIVGTPFANRRTVEEETLVGPLMDLLLLRVNARRDQTPRELIRAVRGATLKAIANADVGFDAIVAEVKPSREAGRNPIFQAMFTLQNAPLEPVRLGAQPSEPWEIHAPTSRLDVALEVDGTVARLEYNTDLFDRTTAERVLGRYVEALRLFVAAPDDRLPRILPSEEVADLLAAARGPSAPAGEVSLIHELVDRAAHRSGDAIAIESNDGRLRYNELVARSRAVAEALIEAGVRRGDTVVVCVERSLDLYVALLAVLRAGAAYLPLDPSYPAERLGAIAQDARARLAIVDSAASADAMGIAAYSLDQLPRAIDVALPTIESSDVAYVMYTSGSTGTPKGVMVPHSAVASMLEWAQRELPLEASDRMLAKTPFTFDISVWEIFGTLAAGATLVVAKPGQHRDASYVAELLADARITVTHFVPSMLRGLVTLPSLPRWPSLRLVIAGGEALPSDLQRRLAEHCHARIVNFYGPTEATIYVSWQDADGRVAANGFVPVGRPVAETSLHVLDDDLELVPFGASGELYIGGRQLAHGYLERPGLTASRFVPDPFAAEPSARIYRTGDVVRRAADGTIDFLGRGDGQIKLRGFRVELGEIEAALREQSAVADAAVELRGDQLVAHLVGDADIQALRTALARTLPEHMIPALFEAHTELPKTTSGKLDRNALAALPLAGTRPTATATATPPEGRVESILADVWAEVLGFPVDDVEANFFELGGDSITLVAVVAECGRRGVLTTVRAMFEAPTIRALAQTASVVDPDGPQDDAVELGAFTRALLAVPSPDRASVSVLEATRFIGEAELAGALRRCEERVPELRRRVVDGSWHMREEGERGGEVSSGPFADRDDAMQWARTTADAAEGGPWVVALSSGPRTEIVVAVDELAGVQAAFAAGVLAHELKLTWYEPRRPEVESGMSVLERRAAAERSSSSLAAPLPHKIDGRDVAACAAAAVLGTVDVDGRRVAGVDAVSVEALRTTRRLVRGQVGDRERIRVRSWRNSEPAFAPVVAGELDCVVDVVFRDTSVRVAVRSAGTGPDPQECCGRIADAVLAVCEVAAKGEVGYVPEDFPLASLTTEELDRLSDTWPDLRNVASLGPMQRYALDRILRNPLDGLFVVCFTAVISDESFSVDAWRGTWTLLMERHPGLRTSFAPDFSNGPVQLVHRTLPVPFRFEDLRELGTEQALAEVLRQETAMRLHLVDPTDEPQWEMRVLQVGDDDFRIICRLVYLLQDGWSVSVLQDEWYPIYDALSAGHEPELPIPGEPYTTHQRSLQELDHDAALEYWRSHLADADLSRPIVQALRARSTAAPSGPEHQTVSTILSDEDEAAFRAFVQRERLTLFTLLQAGWAIVLAGIARREAIAFGTISSGRTRPDIRRTYGSFNNMMPTFVRVDPAADVQVLLADLQAEGTVARSFDFVPLTEIATAVGLPEGADPIDAYIVHENFPINRATQRRFLRWKPDIVEMRTEHAFRMLIWPEGELSFHLSYDARITNGGDATLVLNRYCEVLRGIVAGARTVGELVGDPLEDREDA